MRIGRRGHIQGSLFDSVHSLGDDGPAKGYIVSFDLRNGRDISEAVESYTNDILKFGHDPERSWIPTHEGRKMDRYFPGSEE